MNIGKHCALSISCCLGWLVHVHGSWVALQALQQTEWTLVWLRVRSSACGNAGEMNVHQADLITSSPTSVFVRTPVSAPRPAPTVFQLPWSRWQSSEGAAPPAWIRPCACLAPLSCFQAVSRAGRWEPSWGTGKTQDGGGHRCSSLLYAVRWAVWEGTR